MNVAEELQKRALNPLGAYTDRAQDRLRRDCEFLSDTDTGLFVEAAKNGFPPNPKQVDYVAEPLLETNEQLETQWKELLGEIKQIQAEHRFLHETDPDVDLEGQLDELESLLREHE